MGNSSVLPSIVKRVPMGTPNREPQEYSRNIMECKDPGRYIHIIFLLYSWGSLFEVSIQVPSIVAAGPTRVNSQCIPGDNS